MPRKSLLTIGVAALSAVVLSLPTLAFGNARRQVAGTLAELHQAETPYVAYLLGGNEFPVQGDPDGVGAASVSFHDIDTVTTQVCFDLSYSGIDLPTAAHIHPGAAGTANPPIVDFGTPSQTSFSGCKDMSTALADQIRAAPANFYINVHTGPHAAGAIRGQLSKGPESAGSPHFLPTPLRAYDSRLVTNGKLVKNTTATVNLTTAKDASGTTQIAVPPGATAALITLTVTETEAPAGFLTVYGASSSLPATSNINWSAAGATIALGTQVALSASGEIKVTAGAPSGTHFIIDVVGYLY